MYGKRSEARLFVLQISNHSWITTSLTIDGSKHQAMLPNASQNKHHDMNAGSAIICLQFSVSLWA